MTMQDRFKYRAWNIKNKIYHYNAETTYDGFGGTPVISKQTFYSLLNDDNYIVEQCTGLRDKNGKLIYEGDIVKHIRFDKPFSCKRKTKEVLCVIKWNKELMSFCIVTINTKDAFLSYESHYKEPHFDLYVVGNINENADLLENKDE